MLRLLCLLSSMNAGGAETFLMKVYRTIDRSKYQFDFCINIKEKCFYEDEIYSLGGRIYRIPPKSENLKEFRRQLTQLIQNEGYTHVLRITSSAMGLMDLKIAKKAGAIICSARSSNSDDGKSFKSKLAHRIGSMLYRKSVDVAFAPSDLAAIYTFGNKAYESGDVYILHNALDLNLYSFDQEARNLTRQELGIAEDVCVVGHIGRFTEQKNHMFLAEIFKSFIEKMPNSVLLLVGDGILRDQIEKQLLELGVLDKVIFVGVRSDIAALLSAMDVFVFPSLYEGMPNTVIEAQATGLPCVIADTITSEADITGLIQYLPLSMPPCEWASVAMKSSKLTRRDTSEDFIRHGYDIGSVAKEFLSILKMTSNFSN